MSNVVNHRFVSSVADSADSSLIQPSNWNDGHIFSGGSAGGMLIRDPTDATYGAKWLPGSAALSTLSLTGVVNDYPVGTLGTLWFNNASPLTLTGFAGGSTGQLVRVLAINSSIDLAYNDSRSAAANRLITYPFTTRTLQAGESATFLYDGGIWRLVASSGNVTHSAGALMAGAFVVGNGGGDLYTPNAAGQLAFPATPNPSANANTLDDYREGTWTPSLIGASGTPTYQYQLAEYVKIGRRVDVMFYVTITSKGTLSGPVQIGGLPFVVTATFGAVHFGLVPLAAGNLVGSFYAVYLDLVSTYSALNIVGTAASSTALPQYQLSASDLTNTSYFNGHFSYITSN